LADDKVELTIEIATEESAEIKEIYNMLERMDKKLHAIKIDRTARKIIESGGAPIREEEGPEGPIFRGEEEAPEVATAVRGKKGKGAFERQDAFKNLQGRVEGLEEKTSVLDNLTGATTQAGVILEALGKPTDLFKKILAPIISEFAPIIGAILIAKGLADTIMAELLKPGGIFDRRFKLMIEKLIIPMLDRVRLAEIRQGFRQIRISSFIGPRGAVRGQVRSNIDRLNRGQTIYDERLERLSKGLYP
jgi:hypothetical protein